MRLFLPYVLYKVWCLSKSHAHTNNCKKKSKKKLLVGEKKEIEKQKKKTTAQMRD
jgi:hypothetical protein